MYFQASKGYAVLLLAGAATNIVLVMTKVLLQQIFVMTNTCLSQQKFCCNKHTFAVTKDVFCWDKHVFVTTNTFVATKLLLKQKMILVAAPTNDTVLLLTKLMAQTRDKWWHRPELVDLSFKNWSVKHGERNTREEVQCMVSILSIVLQETGETVVNVNLYTNQKSWLPLNTSIIPSLCYVPLQSRFWNDTQMQSELLVEQFKINGETAITLRNIHQIPTYKPVSK